jgi:hypothetical protein
VWGFTLLSAIFAAFFTGRQAYLANKQLRVARDALAVTQDTEKRQLRAYVGTIPHGIDNFGDVAKQRFTLSIRNFGSTPAYDVGALISDHNVAKQGDQMGFVESTCERPGMRELLTVFPGGTFTFIFTGIQHAIPKERITQVLDAESGYIFIYYGTFCYHDVFQTQHYTNYCWMFRGKGMAAENAEGCAQHNDSN